MSDTQPTDDFGVSIDPATWEDPKETFPGIVEVSTKRWASEKYLESKTFWEGFNPIGARLPQWDLRVRRLDALFVLPDGEQVPAFRYGGVDLKKWSNRERKFADLSSRYHKEWYIVSEWKRIFGRVEPPETLVGRMAMFDFYRSKSFPGSSMPSTNVLVPSSLLPPTYTFTGEVRLIQVPAREAEGTEAATESEGDGRVDAEQPAVQDVSVADILPFLKVSDGNASPEHRGLEGEAAPQQKAHQVFLPDSR